MRVGHGVGFVFAGGGVEGLMNSPTEHTPTTDYHPWVFWLMDALIVGPALLLCGALILWRMRYDESRFRAAENRKKFNSIPPDLAKKMGLVKVGGTKLDRQRASLEKIYRQEQ